MNKQNKIKIARIILDMGISRSELRKAGNKWLKHKEVISSNYNQDKDKYRKRIEKIIDKAYNQGVDILTFPACTFLYNNENELDYYRSLVGKIKWVFSGMLEIKKNSYKENEIILNNGETLEKFDSSFVLGLNLDGISVRTALSSTIKKIRDNGIINSEVKPLSQNQNNILAFDLGHHQYTGRYKMTLQSINNVLSNEANRGSAIFLSYWKYLNGISNYYWYENNNKIYVNMNRTKFKVNKSNKVDYYDVFEINFRGEKIMKEPELVKNIKEVKANMVRFKKAFEKGNDDIINKLSNFKRWYYNKREDIFAPSKFIGYKHMTSSKYQRLSTKVMDGRNTEEVLKSLSMELNDEKREDQLKQKLQSWLDKYDKKVNKSATIRIVE